MIKITPSTMNFKLEHLFILTVLVSHYHAENCSSLRFSTKHNYDKLRIRESYDFLRVDPTSKEIVTQKYRDEATYDQFVKFDFYELDGVDARREFIIIDIRNWMRDPETYRFVTYSEGQLTADPFGNRLIAKPSSKHAAQNVSMCDNNVFEFIGEIWRFKLIKHSRGREKSVVCAVNSRRAPKMRLTDIKSCSPQTNYTL